MWGRKASKSFLEGVAAMSFFAGNKDKFICTKPLKKGLKSTRDGLMCPMT
jgi:hypothetical protein